MQLRGTHTFQAPIEHLFSMLMDTGVLAKVTPGVSALEEIAENSYNAIAIIKMGPVNGKFTGQLEVVDIVQNNSFGLKIKQKSKIGNVAADVKIQLVSQSPLETEMSFDGKAKLSGVLARTGNRVLSGVAMTLSKQFFKSLEKELNSQPPTPA